jgi:hypothetical protein
MIRLIKKQQKIYKDEIDIIGLHSTNRKMIFTKNIIMQKLESRIILKFIQEENSWQMIL